MLVLYPSKPGAPCGVQVHGEETHRWIDLAMLTASEGGALRQAGAPALPPRPTGDIEHFMVQMMLGDDWVQRGGPGIAT